MESYFFTDIDYQSKTSLLINQRASRQRILKSFNIFSIITGDVVAVVF
jgi:hypothetical protein